MFSSAPLPTEKDEVWRYSRIDELDLDRFRPATATDTPATGAHATGDGPPESVPDAIGPLLDALGPRSGLVVTVDGVLRAVAHAGDAEFEVGRIAEVPAGEGLLGRVLSAPHDFQLLNDAFAADPVVIDVRPGAVVADPVVIVHLVAGGAGDAVFPRTVVRAGRGSQAGVVELVVDGDARLLATAGTPRPLRAPVGPNERLVVPVTELDGGRGRRALLPRRPGALH